jgi:molybdate transport system ATP-binding protein
MAAGELIVMTAASFARPGGAVAVRDVTWTVRDGEAWAVTGPTGSGKTTLVNAVAGQLRVAAGRVEWPIIDRARAAGKKAEWPSDVIRRVSFREDSRLFSYRGHYYQQRFEFGDDPDVPTLAEFLTRDTGASEAEAAAAAARLGVAGQLDLSLMKLSNGQTRRARLARALLAHPELLILDDPFVGLDVAGRADVAELLDELVRSGQRVMLVCRPDQVPAWVTNVLDLGAVAGSPDPTTWPDRAVAGSPDPATWPDRAVAGSPDPATPRAVAGSPDPATWPDRRSGRVGRPGHSARVPRHGRVGRPGHSIRHTSNFTTSPSATAGERSSTTFPGPSGPGSGGRCWGRTGRGRRPS